MRVFLLSVAAGLGLAACQSSSDVTGYQSCTNIPDATQYMNADHGLPVRCGPQNAPPLQMEGAATSQTVATAQTASIPVAQATTTPATSTSLDTGVAAFRDLCLAQAGNGFAGSATAASAYGVGAKDFTSLGDMMLGTRADNALSVQITQGKECAITTPNRGGNTDAQFAAVISQYVPGFKAQSFPASARIGNSTYIFQHDRRGGEAYVMLKR